MTKTKAAKAKAAAKAKNERNNAKNKRKRANKAAEKAVQQSRKEHLAQEAKAAHEFAKATLPKPAHLRGPIPAADSYPGHRMRRIFCSVEDELHAPQAIRIREELTPPRPTTPTGRSLDEPETPPSSPVKKPSYMIDYKPSDMW